MLITMPTSPTNIVEQGRAILSASNAYTLRIQVRELLGALCDEVERCRRGTTAIESLTAQELEAIRECDKCDLCEDHHA